MISHEQSGPINGQWSAALILRKKHLIDPLTVIFFFPLSVPVLVPPLLSLYPPALAC